MRLNEAWGHVAAFLIVFAFGTWLFRILVICRLVDLRSATERVAEGDYSLRVPVRRKNATPPCIWPTLSESAASVEAIPKARVLMEGA